MMARTLYSSSKGIAKNHGNQSVFVYLGMWGTCVFRSQSIGVGSGMVHFVDWMRDAHDR
jgi:hypothetical protein